MLLGFCPGTSAIIVITSEHRENFLTAFSDVKISVIYLTISRSHKGDNTSDLVLLELFLLLNVHLT
jgi:hypothetical protein